MKPSNDKMSILIIDDDPVYRNLSRSILKERFNVYAVELPSLAFKILKTETIHIVICDFRLPEMDGLKVLEKIKKEHSHTEVIMISNSGNMDTVIGAMRNGAIDYFKKPFTAAELWMSIERTIKITELHRSLDEEKHKNEVLKKQITNVKSYEIVGNSASIKEIKKQIEMVSATPDTSVLIIGESGTGKELVARGIHALSSRSEEFFGAVNMSAIPQTLFESEFFGHKKGSFTGAIADKAGWFETANKGSLFLDEIGEMSMVLQVKMLRVLEDRHYTKLGTQKAEQFDIRIIAATNKNVAELTDGNNFRLDLFHRLGTFIINLPPLRERTDDIALLADFYLQQLTVKMGKYIKSIHPDTIQFLQSYQFPGNIRELKNLVERAVIVCQGNELLPSHFSSLSLYKQFATPKSPNNETFNLLEIERQTIERALIKVNYNKAEAARLLDIEWNALHRRIRKHKIRLPDDPPMKKSIKYT